MIIEIAVGIMIGLFGFFVLMFLLGSLASVCVADRETYSIKTRSWND